MPYVTVADIASEFKNQTFASDTSVTSAEVAEFITQEQNEVDAIVAMAYSAPVVSATSPNAYSLLRKYTITLVKNRVAHILELDAGTDVDTNLAEEQDKVLERLEKIVEGRRLHDATRISANNEGIIDYNSQNSVSATFQTGTQQW